jgi:hypothetical protein
MLYLEMGLKKKITREELSAIVGGGRAYRMPVR